MSYIYLLDGIEFDAPVNDRELITTIKRNSNLDGFLITQDADLTFAGNAYTYIYQMFNDDTFCSEIEIEILEECEGGIDEIYKGILKLSSAVFEEDDCTVRVKVQDNSFYSYINNNKSNDISPTQTGTKNGIEISPPSVYDIDMFNPNNPIDTATYSHRGYRVYDLIEHAITVMTDGKVGFRSDFLWNQDEELFVTTENALSVAGNNPSFVYSFEKLYSELNKLFNLSFFIEEDLYQTPTLRIEEKDYFYSFSDGITFNDIKSLKVSVDQSKIYGTVLLGSSTLANDQGIYNFNEKNPFFGFDTAKFYPLGQCNLDTELNLVNDYIISSNAIEDCVMGASSGYYDNLFLVSCGDVDVVNKTADAIRYELNGSAPPYIYNLNLNNYNKAQRHFGFLPGDLLDAFNVSSNNFHATKATTETYAVGASGTETPLNYVASTGYRFRLCLNYPNCPAYDFPDESTSGNYDLGGNYDNSTYVYTIPTDGQYTFNAKIFIDVLNADPSVTDAACYVNIRHFDSTLTTLIDENATGTVMPLSALASEVGLGSAVFDCLAGEKIYCAIDFVVDVTNPPSGSNLYRFNVRPTSYFESTSDNVIVGASSINYKILRYEFQLPLSKADFNTLKADPTGLQTFTKWSEAQQAFRVRRAWIEEIKYNNWEQFASVKLIANNAIIQE